MRFALLILLLVACAVMSCPRRRRTVRPAVKTTVKPAVKTTVKLAVKKTVKPAVKKTVKPAVKPTFKLAVKKTVKPAVKPTVKKTVKPVVKTTMTVLNNALTVNIAYPKMEKCKTRIRSCYVHPIITKRHLFEGSMNIQVPELEQLGHHVRLSVHKGKPTCELVGKKEAKDVVREVTEFYCPRGTVQFDKFCYSFPSSADSKHVSYEKASENLVQRGMNLVTIPDETQRKALIDYIKESKIEGDIWTGLSVKNGSLAWHDGYKSSCWYILNDGDTKDDYGNGKCVALLSNKGYKYYFAKCSDAKNPIGSVPAIPKVSILRCEPCGEGWVHLKPFCYYVSEEKRDNNGAQKVCTSEAANLVSVHGEKEHQFLMSQLPPTKNKQDYYIGLISKDSKYTWQDGTPLDFIRFPPKMKEARTDTGDTCFLMNYELNYEWSHVPCGMKLRFMCKKKDYLN